MKILDSSTVIAILGEIHCPEMFEKIAKLGHSLAIPSHVLGDEILDGPTLRATKRLVAQGTIQILGQNSAEEIAAFKERFLGLGAGECDAMLSCLKLSGGKDRVYCILDDGRARARARDLNIKFTGLLGLLKMVKDRGIMEPGEVCRVLEMLKNSRFRLPSNFVSQIQIFRTFTANLVTNSATLYENCTRGDNPDMLIEIRKQSLPSDVII